jgi:NitT/TauT family transport system permease protein
MRYIHLPHFEALYPVGLQRVHRAGVEAGIAAEVIGIPDGSIGERLYDAKVYLSTADCLPGPR